MKMRKQSLSERQQTLKSLFGLDDEDLSLLKPLDTVADLFVECAIGSFPIPFGLATNFVINGHEFLVPMATEEPSVIGAATKGATLIKGAGGFKTQTTLPLLTTELIFTEPKETTLSESDKAGIKRLINETLIPNIVKRGGGFHELEVHKTSFGVVISITLNVCDAMGANIGNRVAEGLKEPLRELIGGDPLLAIMTNASPKRLTTATFTLPTRFLVHPKYSGQEIAKRIVLSTEIANAYENRAVTHNKGIMNGVTALVLATGNDTRAVEGACHHFANRKALSSFSLDGDSLKGCLTLPLSLGTVGGATSSWPPAKLALKILQSPNSQRLCEVACAVGLAQNFAALLALVTDGIQKGHMKLHERRGS